MKEQLPAGSVDFATLLFVLSAMAAVCGAPAMVRHRLGAATVRTVRKEQTGRPPTAPNREPSRSLLATESEVMVCVTVRRREKDLFGAKRHRENEAVHGPH